MYNREISFKAILTNTSIKPLLRSRMVDWMVEVFHCFYKKYSIEIYFRAVAIMD